MSSPVKNYYPQEASDVQTPITSADIDADKAAKAKKEELKGETSSILTSGIAEDDTQNLKKNKLG